MNLLRKLKRLYGEHKFREFKSNKAGSRTLEEYWKGRKDSIKEVIDILIEDNNGD